MSLGVTMLQVHVMTLIYIHIYILWYKHIIEFLYLILNKKECTFHVSWYNFSPFYISYYNKKECTFHASWYNISPFYISYYNKKECTFHASWYNFSPMAIVLALGITRMMLSSMANVLSGPTLLVGQDTLSSI